MNSKSLEVRKVKPVSDSGQVKTDGVQSVGSMARGWWLLTPCPFAPQKRGSRKSGALIFTEREGNHRIYMGKISKLLKSFVGKANASLCYRQKWTWRV